jgi:hypothetical protein
MKDRLITLLGALGALAVVYALFFQRPGESPVTKPLSVESGRNGYLGISRWLTGQGVRVVSLRNRYSSLPEDSSLAPRGNVLVVTMPFSTALRSSEILPLQTWIRAGNTVLILAALDDTPEWSPPTTGQEFLGNLVALSGVRFRAAGSEARAGEPRDGSDEEDAAEDEPDDERGRNDGPRSAPRDVRPFAVTKAPIAANSAIEIEPTTERHPLLEGVEPLRGFSDESSGLWTGVPPSPGYRLALRLGRESTSGEDALWQVPRGDGQVILAASGTLLANRNVGEGGARELVRNLLRYHLASDGAVIFDDMHHGLSSLYDAAAFARDPRLATTVWFVLAGWLIYVLGSSNRLAAPRAPRTAPRQGEFLAAAGGFMARRIDKRAAGRLLVDEWLEEVRRARALPRGPEVWAELEKTPALARTLFADIRGFDRRLEQGGSVDLVRLDNALKQAREAIG